MKKYRTALVTGAASGLGYEFALLLAQDAYRLILVDIDKNKLEQVKSHIQKVYHIQVNILVKNLSKTDSAQEIFEHLDETSVDVLINNAGFGLFGLFSNTNWNRESDMINLHVNTTTQLTKLALKSMLKQGHGKILNIASLAAFQPGPLMSVYYASKAYLLSFSKSLRKELKKDNISVTTICPGGLNTTTRLCYQNRICSWITQKSVLSPEEAAKISIDGMLDGKKLIIPGFVNKCFMVLDKLLPEFIKDMLTNMELNKFKSVSQTF